ncbi:protein kinase [Oculatella sp. LEGE 06141]|uniref:WD40 repeat domain-containing serine/threonine-protein kinase n=1 Tax=Oculatella sp. LEGE 06141 TaxID=1828648 RepID=UPI0018805A31|nr:WD40 repeat domain-containing serine/threonine-protein kinase [Oculatella sp. LEGE 06141]MBE9181943.1 protein kinase [Oculatella sp. LEGE 06141]
MSYCLNPACPQPQNPNNAKFCQACGSRLQVARRYQALKLIGQGGFGRTFLAVDSTDPAKPQCVLKQFFPRQQGTSQRRAIELFHQEALRLAELGQHPQIPALLDHFQWNDSQYLVQEFIDGLNLEQVLAAEGAFNEAQIRALLSDLLPVLDFIHQNQIIHRDIKPENIIRPNRGDRLVLVDFGASKFATGTVLARTGTMIGSAGYVAPEQAMGKACFASDLYGLGVTCIHLLTALHPFDLYSVSEDQWVWPQYLPEPVSRSLEQVLDHLLQRATRQRYSNATDVLQDLQRNGSFVRSSPKVVGSVEPMHRTVRSHRLKSHRTKRPAASPTMRRSPAAKAIPPWQCVRVLTGHTGGITAVAVSPSDPILASGSSDKSIKLWNLLTGELLHTVSGRSLWFGNGHSDRISALGFSPDGQMLISGSDDSTIKLWDMTNQKLIETLPDHGWVVSAIAVSQNGQILASGGGDGVIHVWDLTTQTLITSLSKHRDCVTSLIVSPDGQTLISSGEDKTIRLWDLKTDRLITTLKGHSDRVSAIAVSPDWRILISGSWDRTLKLWNLSRGKQIETLAHHTDQITSIAVSPDGEWFASGSDDSTIRLWSLPDGDRLCTLRDAWGVTSLSFNTEGQILVSGSADATVKIWQYQPPKQQ